METLRKVCGRCGEELEFHRFNTSKNSKDGKANYCKDCKSEYQKQLRKIKYDSNPSLHLLKESCRAAFNRGKPNYVINGYEKVTCSYNNPKEFCYELWEDDHFRSEWISQTNVFLASGKKRDRPTLDRIDSEKGYEKRNIRMLPQWQNVANGGKKACWVFVLKDTKLISKMDFGGIKEAKEALISLYGAPINTLSNVDHGTLVSIRNGLSVLIQTLQGQFKADNESKYLMVKTKTISTFDVATGVEVDKWNEQIQINVSGISFEALKT